jgi:cell division septation protein DedD
LLEAGYRAYTAQIGSGAKGTWFKVRVGNFKERSEAEKTARRLGLKEKLPAFAVAVEREARR